MTEDDKFLINMFLRLKLKAVKSHVWTDDERTAVELNIKRDDEIGILAACCVLVSGYANAYRRAVEVLRRAIESKNLSHYVELSVYEAIIFVPIREFDSFRDAVLSFIEQSLSRRAVDLVNTICLLGILARAGESRALLLLQSLAHDPDAEIRNYVSVQLGLINGISS